MSRKRISRYTIEREGYERQGTKNGCYFFRTFEFARTMRQAQRWARRMGEGALIEQVSRTRTGKKKVKQWIYKGQDED